MTQETNSARTPRGARSSDDPTQVLPVAGAARTAGSEAGGRTGSTPLPPSTSMRGGPRTGGGGGVAPTAAAPAAAAPQRTGGLPEGRGPARPPARRRARLALTRVDPWSVFVLALMLSVFLGIVLLVAVAALYALLDNLGVLSSLTALAVELEIIPDGSTLVTASEVLGVTAVLAAVDVVLLTVLTTLFAFLYNLCAALTGGVQVTLSERE